MFDNVFSNIVGSIGDAVAPHALIAPLWADLFGGAVSGRGAPNVALRATEVVLQ